MSGCGEAQEWEAFGTDRSKSVRGGGGLVRAEMAVVVKTVLGCHFGVGELTTHVRTYFGGDWDVHWGYDLGFDPWPDRKKSQSWALPSGVPFRTLKLFLGGLDPRGKWKEFRLVVNVNSSVSDFSHFFVVIFVFGGGAWTILVR